MNRLLVEFAVRAYIAGALVGIASPAIGSFLVQRRLSLIGDGMGHLAFAGVGFGVVIGISPVWGALIAALAGGVALEVLRSKGRLAGDLALALIFYFGLALGVVLLSLIGRLDASAVGVLFGNIFVAAASDIWLIFALCLFVVGTIFLFYKELLAVALDEETARASGLPVDGLNLLLVVMVALLVAAGMRVVGLLLVAALLVIPVAAGARLAHSFRNALLWAVGIGLFSCLAGLVIALWQGSVQPGGTIVLTSVAVFAIAAVAGRRFARAHIRGGSS
jgi:zinc transport system permease protein